MKKILFIIFLLIIVNEAWAQPRSAKEIRQRLSNFVIKETSVLGGLTLSEAIDYLGETLKKGDSHVNILFNLQPPKVLAPLVETNGGPEGLNPFNPLGPDPFQINPNELALPAAPLPEVLQPKPFDPMTVKLRGVPRPFRNITALQLLEIICMAAEKPTKYYVTDFGVILQATTKEEAALFIRKFNINLIRIRR